MASSTFAREVLDELAPTKADRLILTAGRNGRMREYSVDSVRWLRRMRDHATHARLTPFALDELNRMLPGWHTLTPRQLDDGWALRHGEQPPSWSHDFLTLAREGRLSEVEDAATTWLAILRTGRSIYAAMGVTGILEDAIPGWTGHLTPAQLDAAAGANPEQRHERLRQVEHDEVSARVDGDTENYLRAAQQGRLGAYPLGRRWLMRQRELLASGVLAAETQDAYDATLPGWRVLHVDELDETRRGRVPMRGLSVPVAELPGSSRLERTIAEMAESWPMMDANESHQSFIANQRHKARNERLLPIERQLLDAGLPHWDDALWLRRYRAEQRPEVEERRRTMIAAAKSGQLAALPAASNWLVHQRALEEQGVLGDDVVARYDEAMPMWRTKGPAGLDKLRRAEASA